MGRAAVNVIETERLSLRHLHTDDAAFIFELVNEPSWLRFVGDKGIKTLEDARNYLLKGPIEMYARLGFGLWLVETKEGHSSIGICGLIKRDSLQDVDIGFAFLPAYRGQGYALESASAVMAYGKQTLKLRRIMAVVSPDNHGSARLLEKLGFSFERLVRLPGDAVDLELYAAVV